MVGRNVFVKHFGFEPQGFWLPECGYYQGIEEVLDRNSIKYFFVDGHAIEGGDQLKFLLDLSGYQKLRTSRNRSFHL